MLFEGTNPSSSIQSIAHSVNKHRNCFYIYRRRRSTIAFPNDPIYESFFAII